MPLNEDATVIECNLARQYESAATFNEPLLIRINIRINTLIPVQIRRNHMI